MFDRISRGWRIAAESWAVLKQHPTLLVLPVCSGIAILLLLGSVGGFVYAGSGAEPLDEMAASVDRASDGSLLIYVAVFLFYLATSFIAIFFNAALISCALDAFAGRTPTVRGGLAAALLRLPQIFAWSLVAATAGMVLNIVQSLLSEKLGFIGAILGGLMNIAWAVVTYFVVPVLVVEGLGPIKAVKRSSSILKRTWGESVGGEGGLGIISFLLMLPVFVLIPLGYLAQDTSLPLMIALIALGVLYIVALSIVFSALNTIFRAGTYIYATTGQAPTSMDPALLQGAFRSK